MQILLKFRYNHHRVYYNALLAKLIDKKMAKEFYYDGQAVAFVDRAENPINQGGQGTIYPRQCGDTSCILKCLKGSSPYHGHSPFARNNFGVSYEDIAKRVGNILTVVTVQTRTNCHVYLLMPDYGERCDYEDYIKDNPTKFDDDNDPFRYDVALDLIFAVESCHLSGVYHGDVKSSNIVRAKSSDGDVFYPVCIDYDISLIMREGEEQIIPHIAGTFPFIAPEIIQGEGRFKEKVVSFETDVFSVAMVLIVELKLLKHLADIQACVNTLDKLWDAKDRRQPNKKGEDELACINDLTEFRSTLKEHSPEYILLSGVCENRKNRPTLSQLRSATIKLAQNAKVNDIDALETKSTQHEELLKLIRLHNQKKRKAGWFGRTELDRCATDELSAQYKVLANHALDLPRGWFFRKKEGKNRTRACLEERGWLTEDGTLGTTAPQEFQQAFENNTAPRKQRRFSPASFKAK